jgi:ADP-ribose pyrophosphatase YjhB (NUDIX family)
MDPQSMSTRPRACAAVIRDGKILMVQHINESRIYWTLPGGGVEPGETPAQAAVRETLEESGVAVKILRPLFEREYIYGREYAFLAEVLDDDCLCTGFDPELAPDDQIISDAGWQSLESMQDDIQVSLVIHYLAHHD